jgi:hypothetical protein
MTATTKTAITTTKDLIVGKVLSGIAPTVITEAANAATMNAALNNVFTLTLAENAQLSVTGQLPGQRITLIVLSSAVDPELSFTADFRTDTGTLTATNTKKFVIDYISDGTVLWEIKRTAAITP